MKRIIVGISGASGVIYGVRILEVLKMLEVETHVVISKAAKITLAQETDFSLDYINKISSFVYNIQDIGAVISSGSLRINGMIVAPCSMKTLAEIATAMSSNLLSRAADVTLKERRKLVLMVRETPLHTVHLKHMVQVSEMGGVIAPVVPAFYNKPQNINEMVNYTVGRVLDAFDLEVEGLSRWQGISTELKKNQE